MGLLSNGSPLSWSEAQPYLEHVKQNGIDQLIQTMKRAKGRNQDCLRWGDEVEYLMVQLDHKERTCRVTSRAEEVLRDLKAEMKAKQLVMEAACPERAHTSPELVACTQSHFTATWHPEYGAYMLEGTPNFPYHHDIKDLLCVEQNLILRRRQMEALLQNDECIVSIGNFPRLGCPDSFDAALNLTNDASHSMFFPDAYINSHARFKTLTQNIRERRGSKIYINVPMFLDEHTQPLQLDTNTALFPQALAETPHYRSDAIHLDAMGFGMGCCCLQITFQAREINEARQLYDQLAVLCPIMIALTASTPIFRGILADLDSRWNIISASVDDRTPEECTRIPKSRYASISRYISADPRNHPEYNDLNLPYNEECYQRLCEQGCDELLARHFAWLWVRDPLVIYREFLNQDNQSSFDHFENIQSTNWQTMRLKPPPPENSATGWRVEFRSMEVQFTDFENAALSVFIVLLTRTILAQDLDFYMPISLVDMNMERAQKRNALLDGKFHWRKDLTATSKHELTEASIAEIFNGSNDENGIVGLLPLIEEYLGKLSIDEDTRKKLGEYLLFIKKRASSEYMTPATWMRNFVKSHPEYRKDSIVSPGITHDLIVTIDQIAHQSLDYSSANFCCRYSDSSETRIH